MNSKDNDEDETSEFMTDSQPKNIAIQMMMITQEAEEQDRKQRQARNWKPQNMTTPLSLLQNKEFRKTVTSSFSSTTRENWQQANASKTNPPAVGKYTPKYDAIKNKPQEAVIRDIKFNEGADRVSRKNMESNRICGRMFKAFEDTGKDLRSKKIPSSSVVPIEEEPLQ